MSSGPTAGGLVHPVGGGLGHVVADDRHHVAAERRCEVGGHRLSPDYDRAVEAVGVGEILAAQDRRRRPAGGRTALQPGQRAEDLRRRQHLLDADRVAKHRIRIVGGMLARLDRDLREYGGVHAVLLGVRCSRAAEVLGSHRRLPVPPLQRCRAVIETGERAGPVAPHRTECTAHHLLEPERDHTVGGAGLDRLPRQEQRR